MDLYNQIFPQQTNNVADADLVYVESQGHDEAMHFVRVGWAEYERWEINEIAAVDTRARQTTDVLHQFFQIVVNQNPGHTFRATVYIEHYDKLALVKQRTEWGVTGAYTTPDVFLDKFLDNLENALDNLTNSSQQLDLVSLIFDMTIILEPLQLAGSRIETKARNALRKNNKEMGLFKDYAAKVPGVCGWVCLLQFLLNYPQLHKHWDGDLAWLMENYKALHCTDVLRTKKNIANLVSQLQQQLGINDYEWVMGGTEDSTTTVSKILLKQPRFKIIVYDANTKLIHLQQQGLEWQHNQAESCVVMMELQIDFSKHRATGHLRLIKSLGTYYGYRQTTGYIFCVNCYNTHKTNVVCAASQATCDACGYVAMDIELLQAHQKKKYNQPRCEYCNQYLYNEDCELIHRCLARYRARCEHCGRAFRGTPSEHRCEEYVCKTCKLDVTADHLCTLIAPETEEITETQVTEYGQMYYVFDFESEFALQPDTNMKVHTVNYICVRQCFTDNEWNFENLGDFINWFSTIEKESRFFAHNFKGYDGRLLFEKLCDMNCVMQSVLFRGSKILQFQYGKIVFTDTLLHLPAALEDLPRMFNMDETQFKKGYFPYEFCTPENRNYIGPIPDAKYFTPNHMSPQKRQDFEQKWYPAQLGVEYDFRHELKTYCQSDVRILARAVETYLCVQLKFQPMDPWSRLTIASYAQTMYMRYYMPCNEMSVLSEEHNRMIKRAIHGGRTDARCLLKEWTDEEVRAGKYGVYQDVQSLYPTVQFYDPLPVGPPKYRAYGPNAQVDFKNFFGFACVDIRPTKYLHHPVLVELKDNKLIADLYPQYQQVICSPELHVALANGYVVMRVHWTLQFEQSKDLFKKYFRDFVKAKLEASGIPSWVKKDGAEWDDESRARWRECVEYHHDNLGIQLQADQMIKNSSRKTGAKLMCNSLWGKFAETSMPTQVRTFDFDHDNAKLVGFYGKWCSGAIDVNYHRRLPDNRKILVGYKNTGDNMGHTRRGKINLAVAAFITSHARMRLWTELNKLDTRVLYHDTDSIIYEHDPEQYNIPLGRYLGEWEDELDGHPMKSFVSIGPKCYAYTVPSHPKVDKRSCCKIKGITLNSANSAAVNFASMKQLITKEVDEIKTENLLFKYQRGQGGQSGKMMTGLITKIVRATYSKGLVDPKTFNVYPKGSKEIGGRADLENCVEFSEIPRPV